MTVLLDDGGAGKLAEPDTKEPSSRRRRYLFGAALVALLTVTALLVLRDSDVPVEDRAPVGDAAFEPFVQESAFRALNWAEAMAAGDGLLAYVQTCDAGQAEYSGAAWDRLLADFERFLGGRLVSGEVIDAVVVDGRFYVTMSGTITSGAEVEFMVSVTSDGRLLTVCGYGHPSQIP